jgi:Zn-dependent peptidase ImmA (M78 family)
MPRGTVVPITPSVLEWALKESGYSPEVVAEKIKVPTEAIEGWLRGRAAPRLTEFRKLAALLKRAPATFLLPRPPEQPPLAVEFRRAPTSDRTDLSPKERRYLREGRRLQELVWWIQGEIGAENQPLPFYQIGTDVDAAAADVSLSFLTTGRPDSFKSAAQAFLWFRRSLERIGVLVFMFPIGRDGVRGFSLWDDRSPVVALNTWWRVEARLFTLFHEFGHLLTRTASACLEAGRRLARPDDSVERWCEEFAAAVVLPKPAVEKFLRAELGRLHGTRIESLDVPSRVATRFRVSLRAATLRLIEMNLASWALYAQISPVSDHKPPGGGGRGRDRAEIREGQFGDRTISVMMDAMNRDVLGRTDVLDALDISDADLSKLERRAARGT